MRVTFLGSGDAFGSGGRFNTCFLVEGTAGTALIDCGATSLVALRRAAIEPNDIRTIFISHLHGDHFGGLPVFLLDARMVSRRRAPLTVTGPPGLASRLTEAMEALFRRSSQSQLDFELDVRELEAERDYAIGGFAVRCFEVVHFSGAPSYALRLEADGKILTYSGDTEWTGTLVPAAQGADLFICECYQYDKRVKFHLDYMTIAARREELAARRIVLTHMSQAMLDRLDEIELEAAEDGLAIEI